MIKQICECACLLLYKHMLNKNHEIHDMHVEHFGKFLHMLWSAICVQTCPPCCRVLKCLGGHPTTFFTLMGQSAFGLGLAQFLLDPETLQYRKPTRNTTTYFPYKWANLRLGWAWPNLLFLNKN